MLPGRLESLSFEELERSVNAGLAESRTLDLKRELVGTKDDDKREFSADVSAFANTIGGDIIFGVAESEGVGRWICGVSVADRDAELRRLDAVIRSGIEPRLINIEYKWLGNDNITVLVCRIPKSFASPHRVIVRGHDKFYARNSSGKHPMDVSELRTAFLSGETLVQNIRNFRAKRLKLVSSGEGALPMSDGVLAIMHLVPVSSFLDKYDIQIGDHEVGIMPPSTTSGFHSRYTLEGHASYVGVGVDARSTGSYALLFRSGIIECVLSATAASRDGALHLYASAVEWPLLRSLHRNLAHYKRLGVRGPIYLFLSIINCRGYRLAFGGEHTRKLGDPYNRANILVPELLLDDLDVDASKALRPLFDGMWNAFGFSRALTFDEDDKYIGPKW